MSKLKLAAHYEIWGMLHCAADSFTVTKHLQIPVNANYGDRWFEFLDYAESNNLLGEYLDDLRMEEAERELHG